MIVTNIKERDDGYAEVTLNMDPDECRLLMEAGFNKILKDFVESFENELVGKDERNLNNE